MSNRKKDRIETLVSQKQGLKVINALRIFMTLILLIVFDFAMSFIELGRVPSVNFFSTAFLMKASIMFVLAYMISKIYDGHTVIE